MANPKYSILVHSYLGGQFRIQLTRVDLPDSYAPEGHGTIVREMCTYHRTTALAVVADLGGSDDPEKTARGYARPWNCESPGGRIRLDNKPEDRPDLRKVDPTQTG